MGLNRVPMRRRGPGSVTLTFQIRRIVDGKKNFQWAWSRRCAMVWRLYNKQRDLCETASLPELLIR